MNRFKNGLDDARRNTVMPGNLGEGKRFCKIQKDGIVKSLCHMQRRMNPVRIFIERRMALLAEKPAFMKGDSGSSVMRGKVAYGLPGSGIFNDAVGRAAAWAESLTRHRKIQGDEIIVTEGLDTLGWMLPEEALRNSSMFSWSLCYLLENNFWQLNHTTVRAKRP